MNRDPRDLLPQLEAADALADLVAAHAQRAGWKTGPIIDALDAYHAARDAHLTEGTAPA